MTRRQALRHSLLFLAGSPLLRAQQGLPYTPEPRQALEDLVDVFDFEPLCKAKIPKLSYDFIAGGVDNEWTLRHNREAFEAISFRPHMLAGVQNLDLSLDLFGQRIEMPILIAPTGSQGLAHQQGEIAMARAAGAVKTIMVVSNNSSYPLEKIAAAATGPLWFQHYPAENSREQVERAVSLGCKAVCITVDTTYDSHRERLLRGGESERVPGGVPGEPRPAPAEGGRRVVTRGAGNRYRLAERFTARLLWPYVAEVASYAKVPVLVKGILRPDDAVHAVENGAQGVIVSNHGGRYLEFDPPTIEVLPAIVAAVGSKVPVIVDSGFRRGTDILKALALGAKAVQVGRPPLWGLGAFGQPGAIRIMEMLQTELALAMGLSGCRNLAAIDRSLVAFDKKS